MAFDGSGLARGGLLIRGVAFDGSGLTRGGSLIRGMAFDGSGLTREGLLIIGVAFDGSGSARGGLLYEVSLKILKTEICIKCTKLTLVSDVYYKRNLLMECLYSM